MVPAGGAWAKSRSTSPSITARAAYVVDSDSGEVLWEHNADLALPPASTTKVVTALLALQSGRLDESFPVSSEAAATPPSKISVRAGSSLRLSDLVYAVLLNSANDAAVVIAEGLAGSVPSFARQMNAMARLLGARNTNFVNPNGLPADNHYSSAHDLATIFRHAMQTPGFARAVNTRTGEIIPATGARRRIALHNHNRLLDNYHMRVVGKTGWTRAAKKCLVGAAEYNGREVSFAILGSTDLWGDIKRLLEFGLDKGERPEPQADELLMAAGGAEPSVGGGDGVRPAKKAAVKPAIRPVAKSVADADEGNYSVRLGTFQNYQSAAKVRSSVARRGFSARIEQFRGRKGSVYRVAVGRYSDRSAAQKAAHEIKKTHRGLSTVVVAQY